MLCDTCQRNQTCLPRSLAKQDARVLNLLQRLKKCDLRVAIDAARTKAAV